MFDSASDILPPPPPKALGKDPSTLATDEHGRPVPYLAGRARLGLTWISEPWGVRSVPVRKKVGKKRQTVGYNYFASFAGMLCVGPVQTLHAIIVDDETAWEGPLNAGSNDSAEITVEGRGSLTLYWGTATQGVDAELAASGVEHPAHRGQCYVVFNDGFSLSVFLDQVTRLDGLLNDFLEYLDAALYHTPAGKLSLRLLRDNVTPVALDTAHLLEPPDLTAHGWTEVVNEVVVRFKNRDRNWQTDAMTWRNPAAYAVTGRPLTQALECDWITDPAVAWKVAMAYGKSHSLPWLEGRLRARRSVAAGLRPGDVVALTYPTAGIEDVRFRVLGVEVPGPEAPDVLLTVREDSAHLMVNDYPVPADSALEPVIYTPLPCHDVLVFELPLAWTGKTAARLLVLPARGESLSSAWTLWWERSSNSFSAVGENGLFGRRGELNAGLSSTGLFYLEGGLDVTFTSPDDDLEDMPFDEGVGARRFLIFLGDEILLGWSPTLVSAGRYTLSVVRGQFGTVRRTHALGAECWCVQLGDQPLFEWDAPKWALAVGLKVQPRMLHLEVGLADVAKITHPILLRALRPLGPANLKANGDGVAPTYSTGQNVVLDWDLTSEGRDEAEPEVDLECRADQAILELWAGAVLKGTLYVNRAGPYTLTNAALVAALGAETDFTVRAYLALGGHRSLDFDTVTVTKT